MHWLPKQGFESKSANHCIRDTIYHNSTYQTWTNQTLPPNEGPLMTSIPHYYNLSSVMTYAGFTLGRRLYYSLFRECLILEFPWERCSHLTCHKWPDLTRGRDLRGYVDHYHHHHHLLAKCDFFIFFLQQRRHLNGIKKKNRVVVWKRGLFKEEMCPDSLPWNSSSRR